MQPWPTVADGEHIGAPKLDPQVMILHQILTPFESTEIEVLNVLYASYIPFTTANTYARR